MQNLRKSFLVSSSALKMSSRALSLDRFRGSLIGGVMGDCLGAPFEFDPVPSKKVLNDFLNVLEESAGKKNLPYKAYTDDTAMAFALCKSLIRKKTLDITDLATQFSEDFLASPRRGYAAAAARLLSGLGSIDLNECPEEEILQPAQLLFDGQGSFGNGAAMRVAPVGLFCCKKELSELAEVATKQAIITHANDLAILGAILQSASVKFALEAEGPIVPKEFIQKLKNLVDGLDSIQDLARTVYQRKLDSVLVFLDKKTYDEEHFVEVLGNSVSAHGSVPTAIYAFLKSLNPSEEIETSSIVLRTIFTSIRLGGDTDTIASMAASIAGAFEGCQKIPPGLLVHCEGINQAEEYAEKLHAIVS